MECVRPMMGKVWYKKCGSRVLLDQVRLGQGRGIARRRNSYCNNHNDEVRMSMFEDNGILVALVFARDAIRPLDRTCVHAFGGLAAVA